MTTGRTPERTISITSGKSATCLNSILDTQHPQSKGSVVFLKVAAGFAILACSAVFIYFGSGKWGTRPAVQNGETTPLVRTLPPDDIEVNVSTPMVVATNMPPQGELHPVAAVDTTESPTNEVAVVMPPPEDEVVADEVVSDSGNKESGKPKPSFHRGQPVVVFTEGRKIVRRPGRIEVPRRFSCEGAGIKPFWVYGPKADVEAAKELKARAEWEALRKLAKEPEDADAARRF